MTVLVCTIHALNVIFFLSECQLIAIQDMTSASYQQILEFSGETKFAVVPRPLNGSLVLVLLGHFVLLHNATTAQILKRGPVLLTRKLRNRREPVIFALFLRCKISETIVLPVLSLDVQLRNLVHNIEEIKKKHKEYFDAVIGCNIS
jgi:hypothetical protein